VAGEMSTETRITTLFLDVGGVLLTNGWDRHARARAIDAFGLDPAETEERHHLTFDTYEEGKLTLDQYLSRVVFYEDRPFTPDQFRAFMFDQSRPHPDMIDLVSALKERHRLRVAVVSNEGRELNSHRVRTFGLDRLVDVFVSSCFVHIRKPDVDIFRLALDISQAGSEQVVYIDNTAMFVQVAESLGIRSVLHTGHETTRAALAGYGLEI
jgi:putative hydrolase of the HAD superfamily